MYYMKESKIIGIVLGIVLFVFLIFGITYAYITWTSDKINRTVNSKCFDIYYQKGTDISGIMIPSLDYTGGLYTSVKMNISSSCDIRANGIIYLNTLDTTSSNLYREGLLNYQVVSGSTLLGSGNITSNGEISINVGGLTKSDSATSEYTIYVWVDSDVIENSDINSVYYGSIRAEVIQYG